eukprot:755554-Hanusia_phi.AAC.1
MYFDKKLIESGVDEEEFAKFSKEVVTHKNKDEQGLERTSVRRCEGVCGIRRNKRQGRERGERRSLRGGRGQGQEEEEEEEEADLRV